MFQLTIALLLFFLVALRFVRRVRQEGRRQRALTWPRATAVLTGQHDSLAVTAKTDLGVPIFYKARLEQPYTFYARGERHTGDRLAPELERLNPAEAKTFLHRLAHHRRYEICYDPNDPENNYLTVGKDLLGNRHLLLYAILGVQLPLFLGFLYVADGAAFTPQLVQTFTWVFVGSVFLFLAFYFSVKPVFDLGKLLIPTPGVDAVAEPEDSLLTSLRDRPVTDKQVRAVDQKLAR